MRIWGKLLPLAAAATLWVAADTAPLAAQATGTVTGTVVDATSGRTLESAQMFLPALNMGGLSNNSGRFLLLNIPAGTHEMRVELIGYTSATQQITVTAGQTTAVEFRLNSTALRLQELVVTGVAGETPRIKLPFTVEKVDFTDMPVPAASADGLITGKVPGVKVVKGSGQPGQDTDILLRGPTTITGTQDPLIIIDGVITDNSLADISALDVESIEIVKGAAASSLYGSRAQNGVIQIRTKRGSGLSIDQARITIRNEYGVNGIEGSIPLSQSHALAMSGGQILDFDGQPVDVRFYTNKDTGAVCDPISDPLGTFCIPPNPALNGGSSAKSFRDNAYPSNYTLYNHVDRFFDAGQFYNGYVAVEGRTGTTNYRASFTHQLETGVVRENDGFKLIMQGFDGERLVLSVIAGGLMRLMWEEARRYGHEREAFGTRLLGFQVWRHRLADVRTRIEAADALTSRAIDAYVRGENANSLFSMAKLFSTESVLGVAKECAQIFGGNSYMEEYLIARLFRDSLAFTVGAGTSEIMRELIARQEGLTA